MIIMTWLRKGNLYRETESLLITAQNNAIRTNNVKARCNKIADADSVVIETKRLICERSELAQKEYQTRNDWVGKVTLWELFKFGHMIK